MDPTGTVAVVTGSGRGPGRAHATGSARSRADVAGAVIGLADGTRWPADAVATVWVASSRQTVGKQIPEPPE